MSLRSDLTLLDVADFGRLVRQSAGVLKASINNQLAGADSMKMTPARVGRRLTRNKA